MIQLGNKSIDSIYLGNKVVTEAYIGNNKIWPDSISYEDAVAILVSEDGTITQYFSSCEDAATYATNNSDTNWNLTIRSGDVPSSCFISITNLISLTLEEGVTSIGNYAFSICTGLTGSLVIPDSVTSMGIQAFISCSGFTSLSLGKGLANIQVNCFTSCSGFRGDLVIPSNIKNIYESAFGVNSRGQGFDGTLTIEDGVERLWQSAFLNNNFSGTLVIPSSVNFIDSSVFYDCVFDDVYYYGKSNPVKHPYADLIPSIYGDYTATSQFSSDMRHTVCKVPIDYEDDEFCGLSVSKEIEVSNSESE